MRRRYNSISDERAEFSDMLFPVKIGVEMHLKLATIAGRVANIRWPPSIFQTMRLIQKWCAESRVTRSMC